MIDDSDSDSGKFGQRAEEHRGQNPDHNVLLPSQSKPQSPPPTADPSPSPAPADPD